MLLTYTETIRTVRDGEPRTATSTFTQLMSSDGGGRFGGVDMCLVRRQGLGELRGGGVPGLSACVFGGEGWRGGSLCGVK